ncbi:MAG: RodZ domain-containing protein [Actinomycetota bacterium]
MAEAKSMGAYLRAARRRRRISIERAAEETRIRSDYLMRMESDEFDFLAPTYVRGFLKSYARYLHLDEKPIIDAFDRRFGTRVDASQIVALERHGKNNRALPRKKLGSWGVAAVFAASMILLLAVVGLFQEDDDGAPRNIAQTQGPLSPSPEPEETDVVEEPEPEPTDEEVASTDGVTVEVVATYGDCWVLAAEDGTEVNPGGETLLKGETMTLTADTKVFLRLGFPAGIELIVNGQNLGSPGGQDPVNLTLPDDVDTL